MTSLPFDFAPPPVVDESTEKTLTEIVIALRTVRLGRWGMLEQEIHERLSYALAERAINHRREHVFAAHCRADLWVPVTDGGIVIEVKKRRPVLAQAVAQLHRYARQRCVHAVVLVLERSVPLRQTIEGKPARVVSLNALYGIAT